MAEPTTLIITFVIGLFASFIGSMAGSGGLLSIPFLIFIGLPPQVAVATNKMGALGLSMGALLKFWNSGKIMWRYIPLFSLMGLVGAYIGANLLININTQILTSIIGLILLLMLPVFLIKKEVGIVNRELSQTRKLLGYLLYSLIMVFGGFFGGGGGTLVLYVLTSFFGFTVIEANATNIIPWFLLSFSSFIIFTLNDLVNYSLGIALFFGMLLGGYLGAHIALKKGDMWVKSLLALVIVASSIKLIFFS